MNSIAVRKYLTLSNSMDSLSHLLKLCPVTVTLDTLHELTPLGHLEMPNNSSENRGEVSFVLVIQGDVWTNHDEDKSIKLQPGCIAMRRSYHPDRLEPVVLRSDKKNNLLARFLSGHFVFDVPQNNILLSDLPNTIFLDEPGDDGMLQQLSVLINDEVEWLKPGWKNIVQSLSSTLFLLMVRNWSARSCALRGVYVLLRHAEINFALREMLLRPHLEWTVELLADTCQLSRATFLRRFCKVAKTTPAVMLARVRMAHAAALIRDTGLSTREISEAVGYQSQSAFQRKFKELQGAGPSEYRRSILTEKNKNKSLIKLAIFG